MKYLLLLGVVALANLVSGRPCADCLVVQEGDEAFGAAVHLLNKTLASLAAAQEEPIFTLVKAYSVAILPYYLYPTVTADLKDQHNKTQRCEVTLFKPLDAEDFTTQFTVKFDCENYQLSRNVTLN